MPDIHPVTTPDQIASVAQLAREIWKEHYEPMIGAEQVNYMLDRFQSESAIASQIEQGQLYYLLYEQGEAHLEAQGYLGLIPNPETDSLMISKIYVLSRARGRGYGVVMLKWTETLCRELGFQSIWLTVNKNNCDSIAWYERMGFKNTGAVVQDIGGGFVMDDYRFEKVLHGV